MDETLRRWKRSLEDLASDASDAPMRSVMVESWRRSEAAGVERGAGAVTLHRIPEDELERRLAANADWLAIARPHLEWLTVTFGEVPHVVYLTDRDGIVLHSVGSESFIDQFGLSPGYDWSEARMGTNGAGTALESEQPVAVVGADHFSSSFANCTCTAAPSHASRWHVLSDHRLSSRPRLATAGNGARA